VATYHRSIEEIRLSIDCPRGAAGDGSVRVTALAWAGRSVQYPARRCSSTSSSSITSANGAGTSRMILRRLPPRDAVSTLIGDFDHRELRAFTTGLLDELPATFHHPYLDVIEDEANGLYWAFLEDVSDDMANIGIVDALPDETIRTILSHLAAFHAMFWERPGFARRRG
jgi:hypothetical protein